MTHSVELSFKCSFQARDSDSESVLTTELFIEGIAISSKGKGKKNPTHLFSFVMNDNFTTLSLL